LVTDQLIPADRRAHTADGQQTAGIPFPLRRTSNPWQKRQRATRRMPCKSALTITMRTLDTLARRCPGADRDARPAQFVRRSGTQIIHRKQGGDARRRGHDQHGHQPGHRDRQGPEGVLLTTSRSARSARAKRHTQPVRVPETPGGCNGDAGGSVLRAAPNSPCDHPPLLGYAGFVACVPLRFP